MRCWSRALIRRRSVCEILLLVAMRRPVPPGKSSLATFTPDGPGRVPVNAKKLTMGNTYSSPPLFYEDRRFGCVDCGIEQVWTATQQKWWYEVASGYFFATAIRCRACRKQERARIKAARRAAGHADN